MMSGAGEPGPADLDRLGRRDWLTTVAGAAAAAGSWPRRASSQPAARPEREAPGLIVRSRRPLDLETPVSALESPLTPNEVFFVRSHFGEPARGLVPWPTEVRGLVERPLNLAEEDFDRFEPRSVTAVLQCAGNGRAFFRPTIPGVPWERGAVGQAEWDGVRLADVLASARVRPGAAHVHFLGADGPPSPRTPAFLRSLPLDKALHPDTLLATRMNGEPLPTLHGGPVRLVVPGWTGNHWIKWVRWITVARDEAPGFYMQTGYKIPRSPVPPDRVPDPSKLVPVTSMNVKSLITTPGESARLAPGNHEVRGIAWTGEGRVRSVRVGVRGGPERWVDAELIGEPGRWAWRRWRCRVELARPGRVMLGSQATDTEGRTQPDSTPYNRSGYLWNGIDHVTVEVS